MAASKRRRIYIVDDDPDIVGFMAELLKAAGHEVTSNPAGSHAISEIVAQRPDCVLIDLVMAELDGLELCRELRARKELSGCSLIMVTAKSREYWAGRAAEAGMDGFIAKPLDAGTFVRQVEEIIEAVGVDAPPGAPGQDIGAPGATAAKPLKFYVVDDDPNIVAFITALLEAGGHAVASNPAGSYAISEIVAQRPDCVLIDLVMAELDGLELCRELRARKELSGCALIMVTGKSGDYWAERAAEAGMDGFIAKPLDAGKFVQQVTSIIEEANRS